MMMITDSFIEGVQRMQMKTTRLESKDCSKEAGLYEKTKRGGIGERNPVRRFTRGGRVTLIH